MNPQAETLDDIELLEMLIRLPEVEKNTDKREVRACLTSDIISRRHTI